MKVRRFFCGNPESRSKTFVEQIVGFTRRWSRVRGGLMALPWDSSHVAENTFGTPGQACGAADALYAMGVDGGRWGGRRWGGS